MRIRKVLENSVWFGIIPRISVLLNVLLLPILTPFLTPSDYGIWGIVSSYVSFFVALYTLGLHVHLGNSYYEFKAHYPKVWGRLIFLLIISGFLFSCILFFLVIPLIKERSLLETLFIAFLTTFPVLFNVNNLVSNHYYTFISNPKPLVLRGMISSLIGLVVLYVSVYHFKLGYLGFIFGASVSSSTLFISFIYPLWIKEGLYPRIERRFQRIKNLLIKSLPVIPHALGFVLVSSASRIIMGFYNIPIEEVGIFTNGYMIGDYITIISSAVVTSLVPLMQTSYRSGNFIKYRQYYYFSQAIAFIVIFLFSIWLPEIYIILIRNADLQLAMPIAKKISFANAVIPFYYFISSVVFIKKNNIQLLWLVFLPGIVNILLCLFLIPFYGIDAAIYSTIFSYWSILLVPFISKYHYSCTKVWLGSTYKILFILITLIFLFVISNYVGTLHCYNKAIFTFVLVYFIYLAYNLLKRKSDIFIL